MRLFYRGDLDGFFGLAIDNLVQLLPIEELCKQVLGFPDELLYGRVLPGAAVSLLVGNLFYAWQAHRLAARTGREDVCALPYGINTPRSEERRVGKECRSRWAAEEEKKK